MYFMHQSWVEQTSLASEVGHLSDHDVDRDPITRLVTRSVNMHGHQRDGSRGNSPDFEAAAVPGPAVEHVRALMFIARFRSDLERRLDLLHD